MAERPMGEAEAAELRGRLEAAEARQEATHADHLRALDAAALMGQRAEAAESRAAVQQARAEAAEAREAALRAALTWREPRPGVLVFRDGLALDLRAHAEAGVMLAARVRAALSSSPPSGWVSPDVREQAVKAIRDAVLRDAPDGSGPCWCVLFDTCGLTRNHGPGGRCAELRAALAALEGRTHG